MIRNETVQEANAEAGCSLSGKRQFSLRPGDACDIEMGPGHIADEMLQEHGTGGGTCLTRPAGIFDVGDLGLDMLGIIAVHRKAPNPLADRIACRDQLIA